jgi:hypothetical protein
VSSQFTIQYRNTLDDVRTQQRLTPLWKRLWFRNWPSAVMAVCLAPSIALLLAGGNIVLAAGVAVWLAGSIVRIALRGYPPRELVDERYFLHKTMTVSSDGVEFSWGYGYEKWSWPIVHDVRELEAHLLVVIFPRYIRLVPRRAFRNAAEFDAVVQYMQSQLKATPRITELAAKDLENPTNLPDSATSISYCNTGADYAEFRFEGLYGGERTLHPIPALVMLAFGLMFLLPPFGDPTGAANPLVAAFLIGAAMFSFANSVKRVIWRRWHYPGRLLPQTVWFNEQGIFARDALSSAWDGWPAIHSILENHKFLVIFVKGGAPHWLIPRRAFKSPREPEEFLHAARKLHAEHREDGAAWIDDNAPSDAPAETGNPYQAPRSL